MISVSRCRLGVARLCGSSCHLNDGRHGPAFSASFRKESVHVATFALWPCGGGIKYVAQIVKANRMCAGLENFRYLSTP